MFEYVIVMAELLSGHISFPPSRKMQLVSVGEESRLHIPPPVLAELPENVQLVSVGEEESQLDIPPPELPEKVQLVSVGEEEL